jgi:hypothetical protein
MAERRTAKVGEMQEIVLPGLGASGYQWISEAPTGIHVEQGQPKMDATNLAAGRSVDAVFDVVADAPGTYLVRFEQRRVWEQGVAPIDTREYEFDVAP